MELWAGGFRPRRIAARLAIAPPVVYTRQRRFKAQGLLGLRTRPRERPSLRTRVSVQVRRDVVHRRDNNPLLGPYRAKMALDALGSRDGHTTVWPLVALSKQAHPTPAAPPRTPTPAARPLPTTAPHQVWWSDVRYLTTIDGHWIDSLLLCDGYSRAIVGAGCCDRQHLSRLVQVCRRAIAHWGAPDTMVRDNAGGLLALRPCLQPLGSRWAPITTGHPWQNLAAGGFALQRRKWTYSTHVQDYTSTSVEELRGQFNPQEVAEVLLKCDHLDERERAPVKLH
jgi:hypothetical protein